WLRCECDPLGRDPFCVSPSPLQLLRRQDASHRGTPNLQAPCNLGFADAGTVQLSYLVRLAHCGYEPAELIDVLPCLGESCTKSLQENLPTLNASPCAPRTLSRKACKASKGRSLNSMGNGPSPGEGGPRSGG